MDCYGNYALRSFKRSQEYKQPSSEVSNQNIAVKEIVERVLVNSLTSTGEEKRNVRCSSPAIEIRKQITVVDSDKETWLEICEKSVVGSLNPNGLKKVLSNELLEKKLSCSLRAFQEQENAGNRSRLEKVLSNFPKEDLGDE
ncbi:MAG: hypothetical protein V4489_00265 [Chlamydiota bacterium]